MRSLMAGIVAAGVLAYFIGASTAPDTCAVLTHDLPIEHIEYPVEDHTDEVNEDPCDKPLEDVAIPEARPLPEPRRDTPRHAFRPRKPQVRP